MGSGVMSIVGGAAGFAIGGPAGAAIGAGLGGAVGGAMAAEKEADARAGMARSAEAQQRADRAQALSFASPEQELKQLDRAVAINEQDLQRRERIVASADPALIEAGNQALAMLQGKKSTGALSLINRQRAQQRQQLEAKLRSQLGPGYATSTAGRQALTAFDQGTAESTFGAQQQTLGQLLGVAERSASNFSLAEGARNTASLGQLYGNIANRKISAVTGTPIQSGSQFVGDLYRARGEQQFAGQIAGLAGQTLGGMAGAGAFGGSGGGGAPVNIGSSQGTGYLGGQYTF